MRMNLPSALGLPPAGWSHFEQAAAILALLCVACCGISALVTRAMIHVGVLDVPGHRSSHLRPTPKGGGVGVMIGFLFTLALAGPALTGFRPGGASFDAGEGAARLGLISGAALLSLVSWRDDVRPFHPMLKLAAQLAAALLVLAGLGASAPPWGGLSGALLTGTVALCWLLFAVNALNFIDGLDGLAGGSMALAATAMALVALRSDAAHGLEVEASCLLAAGLLGFLPFNLPRARIFLGDAGSQGAGLSLAAIGLLHWQHAASLDAANLHAFSLHAALAMPLLLCGVLYDVLFTLARRLLAGDSLIRAHRGHLYQVAFRTGIAAPRVALLHWGFVAWGAGLAVLLQGGRLGIVDALTAALLVQLLWTGFVLRRARHHDVGRW